MKKRLSLILALILIISLFGCAKKEEKTTDGSGQEATGKPTTSQSAGTSSPLSEAAAPETTEIGLTRYPGVDGKNNYVAFEGATLWNLDKTKVHPSDSAVIKMACTSNVSSLCLFTNIGSNYGSIPLSIFYDSLLSYKEVTKEIQPCLAKTWEWVNDTTLRMTLRDDVYSHLGDHFTANDVVFSIQWGCSNPKLVGQWGSIFDDQKCKAVDDYTVDIVFDAPSPYTLFDLCAPNQYPMVVEASVEKLGGKEVCGANPLMGTGAYKLKEWDQTAQTIYAERNEDYWGALPYYKYYELHTVTDTTTRCMGVEAGDYNIAQSPSSTSVIAAIDNPDITTYVIGGTAVLRWDFNTGIEPLNVKEVRQALSLAVNYDAIIKVAYNGHTDPADSVMPYSVAWHRSPKEGEKEFYNYFDVERAKQKLTDAGYPDGFELSIMYTSGLPEVTAAVEIINNCMSEIGVKINLEPFESATYSDRRSKLEYQSILGAVLTTQPPSAIKQMDPRVLHYAGTGWVEGHEDEIYGLMEKCMTTVDFDKSFEYLAEFQDLCREYCPSVPLASPKNFNMLSKDIVNYITRYPVCTFPAEYLEG